MTYELLYIIPATVSDDELGTVEAGVKALLEKHGAQINESQRLGKFRFAYPIKKTRYGHYVLVYFDAEGEATQKIDAALRISDNVLRYLIIRREETGAKPFELIQFTEVTVESKAAASLRRKKTEKKDAPSREDISSGVKALESDGTTTTEPAPEAAPKMTDQELDNKLTAVLTRDENEA